MVKPDVQTAIMELIDFLGERDLTGNSLGIDEIITAALTAKTGSDVLITNAAGKDIKVKFSDAAGARKWIFYDSADAELGSMDSNGKLTLAGTLDADIVRTLVDLAITAATGKDVIVTLGDAAGAKKLLIKNSSGTEKASVDSNGAAAFTAVTSSFTGDLIANADAAIDFASGHTDHTLSASEKKAKILVVSAADQAANIIGPAENRVYVLRNASGQAITLKKTGGTGVAVANGKTAVLAYSSTVADYIRITADATH